jgi:effector-binding domain-containing protein
MSMLHSFRLQAFVFVFTLFSCHQEEAKDISKTDRPVINYKTSKDSATSKQAPIVNLTDSLCPNYKVVFMKGTAASEAEIGSKLAEIFGKKLPELIKKQRLEMAGPPLVWYRSGKKANSFIFDAGFPVNKKPSKLPGKFYYKTIGKDSAIIAHYYGPYDLTYFAYEAIKERLKEMKRSPASPAFEIYVDDPMDENGKPKDPFKVRTDIVFPYK